MLNEDIVRRPRSLVLILHLFLYHQITKKYQIYEEEKIFGKSLTFSPAAVFANADWIIVIQILDLGLNTPVSGGFAAYNCQNVFCPSNRLCNIHASDTGRVGVPGNYPKIGFCTVNILYHSSISESYSILENQFGLVSLRFIQSISASYTIRISVVDSRSDQVLLLVQRLLRHLTTNVPVSRRSQGPGSDTALCSWSARIHKIQIS